MAPQWSRSPLNGVGRAHLQSDGSLFVTDLHRLKPLGVVVQLVPAGAHIPQAGQQQCYRREPDSCTHATSSLPPSVRPTLGISCEAPIRLASSASSLCSP